MKYTTPIQLKTFFNSHHNIIDDFKSNKPSKSFSKTTNLSKNASSQKIDKIFASVYLKTEIDDFISQQTELKSSQFPLYDLKRTNIRKLFTNQPKLFSNQNFKKSYLQPKKKFQSMQRFECEDYPTISPKPESSENFSLNQKLLQQSRIEQSRHQGVRQKIKKLETLSIFKTEEIHGNQNVLSVIQQHNEPLPKEILLKDSLNEQLLSEGLVASTQSQNSFLKKLVSKKVTSFRAMDKFFSSQDTTDFVHFQWINTNIGIFLVGKSLFPFRVTYKVYKYNNETISQLAKPTISRLSQSKPESSPFDDIRTKLNEENKKKSFFERGNVDLQTQLNFRSQTEVKREYLTNLMMKEKSSHLESTESQKRKSFYDGWYMPKKYWMIEKQQTDAAEPYVNDEAYMYNKKLSNNLVKNPFDLKNQEYEKELANQNKQRLHKLADLVQQVESIKELQVVSQRNNKRVPIFCVELLDLIKQKQS